MGVKGCVCLVCRRLELKGWGLHWVHGARLQEEILAAAEVRSYGDGRHESSFWGWRLGESARK